MSPIITKLPVPFELWIAKWIFFPIVLVALIRIDS